MKAARLVELHRPAQARLERRVVGRELAAPGAIALLQPHAFDRVVAGIAQAELGAGLVQGLEHGDGELDRHVELPAQLAHVGAARGQHRAVADPDLADGGEGKALVGEVGAAHLLQQRAAFGPHHRQHGPRAGHVGERDMGILVDVAARASRHVAHRLGRAGDDQELVARQPRDGEIALEGAALVQDAGVDRACRSARRRCWRQPLQLRLGIAALDQESCRTRSRRPRSRPRAWRDARRRRRRTRRRGPSRTACRASCRRRRTSWAAPSPSCCRTRRPCAFSRS